MPIQSRDPSECFELFANHVQSLCTETLTSKIPITLLRLRDTRGVLAFQQIVDGTTKAELILISTHLGKLHLFLWQALEARASDDGIFTLTTTRYRSREDIIRFLITDLGYKPPCGDRWSDVLQESERKCHEEFRGTSRRINQP